MNLPADWKTGVAAEVDSLRFQEVYEAVRTNLSWMAAADLDERATRGLLRELEPWVQLQEATDSQVVGLLKRFKKDRLAGTLTELLPATTAGHKLGDHAVADIYIVSDVQYAQPDVIRTLTRGAHAPGDPYPQAVPFEVAMEEIRGHYRIDLNKTGNPDSASLGFADESGVHSKHYR